MAEKLYKSHCTVSGHGMRCEVAEDKQRHKKDVSRLRRRLSKQECRLLTKHAPDVVDSAASVSISIASEVSASEVDSTPATTQVM